MTSIGEAVNGAEHRGHRTETRTARNQGLWCK